MDMPSHLMENAPEKSRAGAHAPSEAGPVDHAHLRRYTMGDLQLELEVLGLFAGELPRTLAALRGAASERDWKMASHTLKGSARAVGAWDVAKAAAVAEQVPFALLDEDHKAQCLAPVDAAVSTVLGYIQGLLHPA